MIDVDKVVKIQASCTDKWHHHKIEIDQTDFYAIVQENMKFNYELWHEEDKARRDDCGFEYVRDAKRVIDDCNQQRNNRIEKMDRWIVDALEPATQDCPSNSETPGMMIDRLSILSLKSFHMNEQVIRQDVGEEHRASAQQKLEVIKLQLTQLSNCLRELLVAVADKTRTFNVYYQFKMYNDPSMNPQLYKNKEQA